MKIYPLYKENLSENAAYCGIYGRIPPKAYLPKSTDATEDEWNGILKDIHLKNKWLDVLNRIENIEVISTCEGHSQYFPTHIIIKILRDDLTNEEFYNRLIYTNYNACLRGTFVAVVKCYSDIYYCLTYYSWYRLNLNNYKWERWWINIIPHIHLAVNK